MIVYIVIRLLSSILVTNLAPPVAKLKARLARLLASCSFGLWQKGNHTPSAKPTSERVYVAGSNVVRE